MYLDKGLKAVSASAEPSKFESIRRHIPPAWVGQALEAAGTRPGGGCPSFPGVLVRAGASQLRRASRPIVISNRVFEGRRTLTGRIGTVLMASAQPSGALTLFAVGRPLGIVFYGSFPGPPKSFSI